MPILGDFFPQESKEQLANFNFKPGAVLRYHVDNTNPPKVKRLVVIAVDDEKISFAYVFINSEINPNVFRSEEMKDCHLELTSNGRPYLDHTSFVDCTSLHEYSIDTVKGLMTNSSRVHIGEMAETDFRNVVDKIRNAPTISTNELKKYGLA